MTILDDSGAGIAPLVITGATGRIARLLRAHADLAGGMPLVWAARRAGPGVDLVWDLDGPAPALPPGAVVLHLAARLTGAGDLAAANVALLRGVMRAAQRGRARRILVASSAAVYGASGDAGHEDGPARPVSAYGHAKRATEAAALAWAGPVPLTVLRIGNVPGADALLGLGRSGPVTLDPAGADGRGPVRSWIGPRRLAGVILALARGTGAALPPCLNLAEAPPMSMADVLDAAGIAWHLGPPRPGTIPRAVLDTRRLQALLPLPAATPATLVADWRATMERLA